MPERLTKDQYFMKLAKVTAERANCKGRHVGSVLVRDERVIATGYNGTAKDMKNCLEDGCVRCSNPTLFPPGTAYDICVCVHAEANVLASAARFGISTNDTTLYCTHQPCFTCSKDLIQAGVTKVWYAEAWGSSKRSDSTQDLKELLDADYQSLQEVLGCELLRIAPNICPNCGEELTA